MNNQKMKNVESKIVRRWIISDTHFFHTKVIEFCNRPYENVKKMNYDMIQKWNSVVGQNDLVYFLGDLALQWGEKKNLEQLVNMLHGKKVMIMGNHDTKTVKYYINLGFNQCVWGQKIVDERIVLCHQPPNYISKDYIYLFGHVHNKECPQDKYPNCYCVCADRHNLTPIDYDELIKDLKNKNKTDIIRISDMKEEKI